MFFDDFSFNESATTEIYTLSLHDALPICALGLPGQSQSFFLPNIPALALYPFLLRLILFRFLGDLSSLEAKKIGRAHVLNSSHANISYAVFCLKKKKLFSRLVRLFVRDLT